MRRVTCEHPTNVNKFIERSGVRFWRSSRHLRLRFDAPMFIRQEIKNSGVQETRFSPCRKNSLQVAQTDLHVVHVIFLAITCTCNLQVVYTKVPTHGSWVGQAVDTLTQAALMLVAVIHGTSTGLTWTLDRTRVKWIALLMVAASVVAVTLDLLVCALTKRYWDPSSRISQLLLWLQCCNQYVLIVVGFFAKMHLTRS